MDHFIFLFTTGIGFTEIALIIIVVFILFGAKRIPEIMRSLGKGLSEFKKVTQELQSEAMKEIDDSKKVVKSNDKPKK